MVLTRDQPRRQTWRDTQIPRSHRTLVSIPLFIHRPTPTHLHPKASVMAEEAPHSSSNTSKILKQLSRMNRPIHRSTASSTSMYPFGSGTSFLNRVTDAVVLVLRYKVLGWCGPPRFWLTVSSCLWIREFDFLRFVKLWSRDRFRRDRKWLMSVVGLVLRPYASLVLFRMSYVSFKISLKFVDKPWVYVILPPYIYNLDFWYFNCSCGRKKSRKRWKKVEWISSLTTFSLLSLSKTPPFSSSSRFVFYFIHEPKII